MHAGEAETSILLAESPGLVDESYTAADHLAEDRRHLLTIGVAAYAPEGVIGLPSLASAEKGRGLLDAFSTLLATHLKQLVQTA